MRISTKSAVLLAITSIILTALPAEARPRWSGPTTWRGGSYDNVYRGPGTYYRYGTPRYYGSYYGGYSSYYGGRYGHDDDLAIAVGAGLLGIMLGTALSSRSRGSGREYGDRPKVDYYESRAYPRGFDRYESRRDERDVDRNYNRSEDRRYQQDLAREFGRDERSRRQDYARDFGRSTPRANQQEVASSPATGSDRYDRGDYAARYYDKDGKYDPDRYYREGGDGGEGADPFSLDSRRETDKDYGAVGM